MTVKEEVVPTRTDLSGSQRAMLDERLRRAKQAAARPADARPSIGRRKPDAEIPLSFAQQRLWFLDQLEPGSPVYNVCQALRIQGVLNTSALERALNEIIRRHDVLRTNFVSAEGRPVQVITPDRELTLAIVDLSDATNADAAELRLSEESRRPFDLSRDLLIRGLLIKRSTDEHLLLLTLHHVISDGWSIGILFRELAAYYHGLAAGHAVMLPELPIQYADYAVWERETLQGPNLERLLSFWRRQLEGPLPVLELPFDHPRPLTHASRGAARNMQLPQALSQQLKSLGHQEGATLFMTLLAAFQVLLYRWSGQDDLVVGSVVAGRRKVELEQLIGFFVNTLVFRADLRGEPSFRQFLARTKEVAFGVLAHQDLPFERLVNELRPDRTVSRNPLFQAMFVLQNAPMAPATLPQLHLEPFDIENGTSKFDLTLSMLETPEGLRAAMEYNADLFEPETIDRLLGSFHVLLEGIASGPDRPISKLPLVTETERRRLLQEWNATATAYPRDKSVPHLFDEQAARTPDAVAVTFAGETLTYAHLAQRANQLARMLRRSGVGPDMPVAVSLERSLNLVVTLLGILKAGAAYVSLDVSYPADRLAFMLRDAAARVLVTEEKLRSRVEKFVAASLSGAAPDLRHDRVVEQSRPRLICIDSDWPSIASESSDPFTCDAGPESLAYISYTSGSTGQPKGVCVHHRGVVRLVVNTNYAHFGPDEVFLQFAPIAFDASTLEIWGPLLNGGRLVVYPPGPASLSDLGEFIDRSGITTLWLTAGLFHQMVEEQIDRLKNVRQLLAGGDVLSPTHVARAREHLPATQLINGYGPTENTTFTCCQRIAEPPPPGRPVPIGRPIANTQVYILDARLQPVPVGVAGELYAGGDGLARGYLNRPELTAERFAWISDLKFEISDAETGASALRSQISDLKSEISEEEVRISDLKSQISEAEVGVSDLRSQISDLKCAPSARLYRTGDRARWLPDGTIEFLGRIDRQVKIRGFRVEPAETEAVLATHPAVKECAVVVRTAGDEKRLVTYIVTKQAVGAGGDSWSAFLAERVPEYLIPSAFYSVPALPLTPNGKLDVEALPFDSGARPEVDDRYVAPRDDVERQLAGIWEDVLNVHPVGIQDQFFALGGHSLLAVRMIARVEKAFGQKLPVAAIFQNRTIEQLAKLLRVPDRAYESATSIVEIHGEGTRPRLHLVHGVGGGMFWGYANLARHLGADQPLFALKSRGLDGQPEWPTIEEMAASYIADLRAQQPRGPYLLGGYCFGGIVAYEMARQLRQQGENVPLLALINGSPPNTSYQYALNRLSPVWLARFAANFAYWLSCFTFRWTWRERSEFVRWKLRVMRRRAGGTTQRHAEVALGDVDQLVDLAAYSDDRRGLWRSHVQALIKYQPQPYDGSVTLIRTRGHPMLCSFDWKYGWGELARGGVDVHVVAGGHGNVLAEPYVASVANALRRHLDDIAEDKERKP